MTTTTATCAGCGGKGYTTAVGPTGTERSTCGDCLHIHPPHLAKVTAVMARRGWQDPERRARFEIRRDKDMNHRAGNVVCVGCWWCAS